MLVLLSEGDDGGDDDDGDDDGDDDDDDKSIGKRKVPVPKIRRIQYRLTLTQWDKALQCTSK